MASCRSRNSISSNISTNPAVQPGHSGKAVTCWDALSRERDAYAAGVEEELIGPAKAAAA
jgi:hypothetical protein